MFCRIVGNCKVKRFSLLLLFHRESDSYIQARACVCFENFWVELSVLMRINGRTRQIKDENIHGWMNLLRKLKVIIIITENFFLFPEGNLTIFFFIVFTGKNFPLKTYENFCKLSLWKEEMSLSDPFSLLPEVRLLNWYNNHSKFQGKNNNLCAWKVLRIKK